MKSDVLTLTCDPTTRDPLEIRTEPDPRGRPQEFLVNPKTGRRFLIREMIRVARPGTKFVVGDENEALARKYEKVPVTRGFYGNRKQAISAPVDLLPSEMQDVQVKDIAGGDLYCLSFRKPR